MPTRTIVLTALIASCVSSLVTLTVALLVLAPSIRAAPDPQDGTSVLQVRGVEIVDSQGNTRAYFGMKGDPEVTLQLRDYAGRPRAVLDLNNLGMHIPTDEMTARLSLYGARDTAMASAHAGPFGNAAIGVSNASQGSAAMSVQDERAPRVELVGAQGEPVWQAP